MTEDVRPGKRFEFNRNLFIVARSKIGVQRNTIVAQNKFASAGRPDARRENEFVSLGYAWCITDPIKYYAWFIDYTSTIYYEKIMNRVIVKRGVLRINFNLWTKG